MKIHYFGTSLTESGHYFWDIDTNSDKMIYRGLSFPKGEGIPITKHIFWPFDPETMPRRKYNTELVQKGTVRYYREGGYTIFAIEGSCKDNRDRSKSVFFTDEHVTFGELVVKTMAIPVAREIIKKMPFEVKWLLNPELTEKVSSLMK